MCLSAVNEAVAGSAANGAQIGIVRSAESVLKFRCGSPRVLIG